MILFVIYVCQDLNVHYNNHHKEVSRDSWNTILDLMKNIERIIFNIIFRIQHDASQQTKS